MTPDSVIALQVCAGGLLLAAVTSAASCALRAWQSRTTHKHSKEPQP